MFSDEHGDFPAGSYIRNPPTSRHTPGSAPGCTILVKLHQFDPADRTHVRVATNRLRAVQDATRPGVRVTPLFTDDREDVRIEDWAPGAAISLAVPGGLEAFVLDGGFTEGGDTLAARDWLRLPSGSHLTAQTGAAGARVWIKTGHLAALG